MARAYTVIYEGSPSAAVDLFEIVAPAAGTIKLAWIDFGQSSDYGDAAAEGLALKVIRAHSTSGSGGSSATPRPCNSADAAAAGTYEVGNTTQATGGSPVTLHSTALNIQAGYQFVWPAGMEPTVRNSERMVVTLAAAADAITVGVTIGVIEE